ncbi:MULTISPECIES: alpha/beta hydrolase [Mycolicibacterium]|uniref:Serine hydrolase domain-containing protein n=1 Tax=Mycolicibacterium gilvum (strain DSM 45189 / LMG 24558 / Spyr1) TaxID=278137 RepID=E6TNL1_MYCSR|nr:MULTISPECIES: alpha/beta hydrolase [Mycolicibacterium]ADU01688.1 hypothetical protein Mspyr1_51610 [Mycolicibacterium gilvum Spyr1]MBV5242233.1 alpha/beta hydrolase [Mycolicibacterium sp. PAM1]
MTAVQYAPGRSADLYGDPADQTVLLWHGTQTDARHTVGTLAGLLVERGFSVVVPDWDSHSSDGGRSDLLASADFARDWTRNPDGLIVVGWSLGAAAAAGLTADAGRYDLTLAHTVCLAGAFMAHDPISGADLTELTAGAQVRTPFLLLHGTSDDVVGPEASRDFAAHLEATGWPVSLTELDADHGDIAGARYDARADRYEPADDPATRRVAGEVADLIASVTSLSP